MKADRIAHGEPCDQGLNLVGIPDGETLMRLQRLYPIKRIGQGRHGLGTKPLVDHEIIALEALVEVIQRCLPLRRFNRCLRKVHVPQAQFHLPCLRARLQLQYISKEHLSWTNHRTLSLQMSFVHCLLLSH